MPKQPRYKATQFKPGRVFRTSAGRGVVGRTLFIKDRKGKRSGYHAIKRIRRVK